MNECGQSLEELGLLFELNTFPFRELVKLFECVDSEQAHECVIVQVSLNMEIEQLQTKIRGNEGFTSRRFRSTSGGSLFP